MSSDKSLPSDQMSTSHKGSAIRRYVGIVDLFSALSASVFAIIGLTATSVSSVVSANLTTIPMMWMAFPFDYFGLSSFSSLLCDDFSYASSMKLLKLVMNSSNMASQSSDNFVFVPHHERTFGCVTVISLTNTARKPFLELSDKTSTRISPT